MYDLINKNKNVYQVFNTNNSCKFFVSLIFHFEEYRANQNISGYLLRIRDKSGQKFLIEEIDLNQEKMK